MIQAKLLIKYYIRCFAEILNIHELVKFRNKPPFDVNLVKYMFSLIPVQYIHGQKKPLAQQLNR